MLPVVLPTRRDRWTSPSSSPATSLSRLGSAYPQLPPLLTEPHQSIRTSLLNLPRHRAPSVDVIYYASEIYCAFSTLETHPPATSPLISLFNLKVETTPSPPTLPQQNTSLSSDSVAQHRSDVFQLQLQQNQRRLPQQEPNHQRRLGHQDELHAQLWPQDV